MKKNIVLYILFFCLIFCLAACKNQSNQASDDDWESEVLWAEECGQDGLSCCLNEEPSCKFGQTCCVSPGDPSQTYCADECRFGELDEFCRAEEPECNEFLVCADYGRCAPCGGEEQACCLGDQVCEEDLVCNGKICETCGLAGNVCCKEGLACLDQDKRDKERTECQINNICSYCGSQRRIACQAEPRCNKNHLLNSEQCYPCGEINQPCCQDKGGTSYCNHIKGFECHLGFCSK